METIISFLNKNNIEYKVDNKGIEYEGFYSWFFISNLQIGSIPINLQIKDIKNNINH